MNIINFFYSGISVAIISDCSTALKWLLSFQIIIVLYNDWFYFRLLYHSKMAAIVADYWIMIKFVLLFQIWNCSKMTAIIDYFSFSLVNLLLLFQIIFSIVVKWLLSFWIIVVEKWLMVAIISDCRIVVKWLLFIQIIIVW